MVAVKRILIEGYTAEEILALPDDDIAAIVFSDEPLVVRVGSAEILAEFRATPARLVVELAQIEEGGEGVLLALSSLVRRYARSRAIAEIEWIVHAVSCARPNLKLRRVLQRRGFSIDRVTSGLEAYYLIERLGTEVQERHE